MNRVLIVDDQTTFRADLRELLTLAGLMVVGEASNIPEAQAQAQALQPDLAVVDVFLPGVNGLEGLSRLKAVCPTLHVILISACYEPTEVLQAAATEAGAEVFIPKDSLDLDVVRAWKE